MTNLAASQAKMKRGALSAASFPSWEAALRYALVAGRIQSRRVVVRKAEGAWRWGWAK